LGTYLAGITATGKTERHKKNASNVRDIAAIRRCVAEILKRTSVFAPT
jgi:hypothetical protein